MVLTSWNRWLKTTLDCLSSISHTIRPDIYQVVINGPPLSNCVKTTIYFCFRMKCTGKTNEWLRHWLVEFYKTAEILEWIGIKHSNPCGICSNWDYLILYKIRRRRSEELLVDRTITLFRNLEKYFTPMCL